MNILIPSNDLLAVYKRLKDRYAITLTNTSSLNEGFRLDCPIIVGKAHGLILELYLDGNLFVLDIMDEAQIKGTHWHPNDVASAVADIAEFMEGKTDYPMFPFPQP